MRAGPQKARSGTHGQDLSFLRVVTGNQCRISGKKQHIRFVFCKAPRGSENEFQGSESGGIIVILLQAGCWGLGGAPQTAMPLSGLSPDSFDNKQWSSRWRLNYHPQRW